MGSRFIFSTGNLTVHWFLNKETPDESPIILDNHTIKGSRQLISSRFRDTELLPEIGSVCELEVCDPCIQVVHGWIGITEGRASSRETALFFMR